LEFQKTVSLFAKREMVFCASQCAHWRMFATMLRLIRDKVKVKGGTPCSSLRQSHICAIIEASKLPRNR
ncbi:MAG: hypothetical protein RSD32_08770, partial [Oscillospiraceae bacterium]